MPSEFKGHFVSVLSLMRDGGELATRLREVQARALDDPRLLRSVIDPYVEIVAPGLQCAQTGLQLSDIWRYFRHTWSNQYTTTPGRTMALLVRDRAAPYHPIIGIGALASSIVAPSVVMVERLDGIPLPSWASGTSGSVDQLRRATTVHIVTSTGSEPDPSGR
jgi:hypothetical protein